MGGAWRCVRGGIEDESGGSLVEYVMLVSLVAVVSVAAVSLLGQTVKSKLDAPRVALSQ